MAPLVSVEPESPTNIGVELITAPGAGRILATPGEVMIARVSQPSTLIVRVSPRAAGGSTDAAVKIERLGPELPAANVASDTGRLGIESARKAQIELLAHVSRRGDVKAGPGEWIAGPALPAQIEGIAVAWHNAPSDVQLRYAASIGTRPRRQTDVVDAGVFVGTRGRALPLVGLSFELAGPGARRYRIVAKGVFLGSAVVTAEGNRINMAGPTGGEPLVGLTLEIVEWAEASRAVQPPASDLLQPVTPVEQPDRLEPTPLYAPLAAAPAETAARTDLDENARTSGPKRVRVFRSTKTGEALAT